MNRIQEIFVQTKGGRIFDLQLLEDDEGLFAPTGIFTNEHNEQAEWQYLLQKKNASTPAAAFENLVQGLKAFCERFGDTILFIDNPNNTELLTKNEQEVILGKGGVEAMVRVNGA